MPPSPALRPLSTAAAVLLSAAAGAALHHVRHGNSTAPSPATSPGAAAAETNTRPGSAATRPAMPTRESLAALSPDAQFTALAAALPQMEVADILPLVEHLLKARHITSGEAPADPFAAPPPDLISPLLRALFTRWSELDAAGLMAYVESGPLRYDYSTRHLAVLALVEVRGLSALEEVRAKSPSLAREAAREMLIRQPGQLEALLPFLKGGYRGNSIDEIIEDAGGAEAQIATALGPFNYMVYRLELGLRTEDALNQLNAKLSPEDVLHALHALPPGQRRDKILSTWLLSKVPYGAALSYKEANNAFFLREYEALPEGAAKSSLNSRYAILRALENPDNALKWAHSLPNARQRFEAVTTICASLFIETDGGNTFLSFYGREGDAAERLTREFAEAWMAAPQDSSKLSFESAHATRLLGEWHNKTPAAAELWLATLPNPELLKLLTKSVPLSASALKLVPDTELRLDIASRKLFGPLAFEPSRSKYFATMPAEWSEAARLHYLESNPPGDGKWETLTPADRRALSAAAIRTSAEIAVHDTGGPPTLPDDDAPTSRKDWLTLFNSLPPEERSLGAYYETGAAYIKQDETAASQWLDSLPPGQERDAAATALVEHLVKPGDSQDGEAAFAWAAAMSGETERSRYTAEAARAWAAEDPAAARAAVESSALPAAEKSALLQSIPEGGTR